MIYALFISDLVAATNIAVSSPVCSSTGDTSDTVVTVAPAVGENSSTMLYAGTAVTFPQSGPPTLTELPAARGAIDSLPYAQGMAIGGQLPAASSQQPL